MLEHVPRVSRLLTEGPSWTPDWRNRQATAYLLAFNSRVTILSVGARNNNVASSLLPEVRFPAHEDDAIVKGRFWHLAGAPAPNSRWTQAFDLCQGLVQTDATARYATAIKGWLLAGLSDDEIAERHPISPFMVRLFHDVWFDVRGYLNWKVALNTALCGTPQDAATPEWERRERTILRAALWTGADAVDRLIAPRNTLDPKELEWLVDHRIQTQSLLAWDRTQSNFGAGFTRQTDIAIHQEDRRTTINKELANAKQALDNHSDEKYRQFFDQLSSVYEEQGAVSDPSEFFASGLEEEVEVGKEKKGMARRVG